jgi:hypothetical protein
MLGVPLLLPTTDVMENTSPTLPQRRPTLTERRVLQLGTAGLAPLPRDGHCGSLAPCKGSFGLRDVGNDSHFMLAPDSEVRNPSWNLISTGKRSRLLWTWHARNTPPHI